MKYHLWYYYYGECRYDEFHYAECHGADAAAFEGGLLQQGNAMAENDFLYKHSSLS